MSVLQVVTANITNLSDGTNTTSSTNSILGSAKVWINYNGSSPTIRASYNVSSVTKNGTGDYTLNFTNALSDANYAAICGGGDLNGAFVSGTNRNTYPPSTTQFRYTTYANGGSQADTVNTSVAIFR